MAVIKQKRLSQLILPCPYKQYVFLTERQPRMRTIGRQYGSGSGGKGHNMLQRNNHGVTRVMVGGRNSRRQAHGLTQVGMSSENRERSLHQTGRPVETGYISSRQPAHRSHINNYRSRSTPAEKLYEPQHVEEEFMFVPHESGKSLPRNRAAKEIQFHDQTNTRYGLRAVSENSSSQQHRQGPYSSIKDYEEAQRNKNFSHGRHATTESENIAPPRALVMQGSRYSIESSNRPVQRYIVPRQRNQRTTGLRLVEDDRFPVINFEESMRPMSAGQSRKIIFPNKYRRPQSAPAQQSQSKQLQLYSPPPQGEPQPEPR